MPYIHEPQPLTKRLRVNPDITDPAPLPNEYLSRMVRERLEAATHIEALECEKAALGAEIERLRAQLDHIRDSWRRLAAAFRVNMLRANPTLSHDDLDAVIRASLRSGKSSTEPTDG